MIIPLDGDDMIDDHDIIDDDHDDGCTQIKYFIYHDILSIELYIVLLSYDRF